MPAVTLVFMLQPAGRVLFVPHVNAKVFYNPN
jgi:hypothetical protein